jgi:UDP-N-acetylenolpyruvoylglucosamine reductase
MGNERVIDRVEENASNDQDASSRLHDDAYSAARRDGTDKNNAGTKSGGSTFDNPYDHVTIASAYLREFESLQQKKDDEKIKKLPLASAAKSFWKLLNRNSQNQSAPPIASTRAKLTPH